MTHKNQKQNGRNSANCSCRFVSLCTIPENDAVRKSVSLLPAFMLMWTLAIILAKPYGKFPGNAWADDVTFDPDSTAAVLLPKDDRKYSSQSGIRLPCAEDPPLNTLSDREQECA